MTQRWKIGLGVRWMARSSRFGAVYDVPSGNGTITLKNIAGMVVIAYLVVVPVPQAAAQGAGAGGQVADEAAGRTPSFRVRSNMRSRNRLSNMSPPR
jgi:hypothetical protein